MKKQLDEEVQKNAKASITTKPRPPSEEPIFEGEIVEEGDCILIIRVLKSAVNFTGWSLIQAYKEPQR